MFTRSAHVLGLVAALLGLAACTSVTPAPHSTSNPSGLQVIASGLDVPWGIAFLPDGSALVTERDNGTIDRIDPKGGHPVRVATIGAAHAQGEGGLLGIAVSPHYATDGLIFIYYSTTQDNRIARMRLGQPPQPIVTGIPHSEVHNGGRLGFGPDGFLYASTGDGTRRGLAQDRSSLAGKILRMNPDGTPAPGNPFGTLVWSYGHRNVQGLAWDREGRLYAAELGQDSFDEVNRIERGRNYGWPVVEGSGGGARYADPEVTWAPEQASPSGAAIAAGSLWIASLRGARLWQVPLTAAGRAGTPSAHFAGEFGRLRAVVRAPDGALWCTTSNKDGRGTPQPHDDKILVIPLR